jgi:hypothetical protein
MPCSVCGQMGHNARTCKNKHIAEDNQNPVEDNEQVNIIMTMLLVEDELRYLITNNMLDNVDHEKIKFYESFLNIKYKEINLINLNRNKRLRIYMMNCNINLNGTIEEIKFIGILEPRNLYTLKTFTGYKYLLFDEYSDSPDEIIIDNTNDKYLINNIKRNDMSIPSSKELTNENESLFSTLKLNYLIQQMIRLGGMKDDNYSCILDLHKDIKIPDHDDLDLEASGLPNEIFTNN